METITDPVVAAASAAFGSPLTDPVDLGGGSATTVLRCRTADDGTVVVKSYQDDPEGRSCFAAEAAGLAFTSAGPELLTVHADEPLLVMSDLGTAPSLADALLGGSPDVARAGVLAWARGYGSLAAATQGRQADLAALRATYQRGTAGDTDENWVADSVAALPAVLAEFAVPAPAGLAADLAEVTELADATDHLVFSPGDICPDNNILTDDGLRVLDFEAAGYRSVFLDAAYATMPFASCWCVFHLPPGLGAEIEATYRSEVVSCYPDLADDTLWHNGIQLAVAVWTIHVTTALGARTLVDERPMHRTRRPVPTGRQLLRHRWQYLIDVLTPTGRLPALTEAARGLLTATEPWQVAPLPLYPAFQAK